MSACASAKACTRPLPFAPQAAPRDAACPTGERDATDGADFVVSASRYDRSTTTTTTTPHRRRRRRRDPRFSIEESESSSPSPFLSHSSQSLTQLTPFTLLLTSSSSSSSSSSLAPSLSPSGATFLTPAPFPVSDDAALDSVEEAVRPARDDDRINVNRNKNKSETRNDETRKTSDTNATSGDAHRRHSPRWARLSSSPSLSLSLSLSGRPATTTLSLFSLSRLLPILVFLAATRWRCVADAAAAVDNAGGSAMPAAFVRGVHSSSLTTDPTPTAPSTTHRSPNIRPCTENPNEFICYSDAKSGPEGDAVPQCIDNSKVCDGVVDCPTDGRDEWSHVCDNQCTLNFQWKGFRCISAEHYNKPYCMNFLQLCNGQSECEKYTVRGGVPDLSDETNCTCETNSDCVVKEPPTTKEPDDKDETPTKIKGEHHYTGWWSFFIVVLLFALIIGLGFFMHRRGIHYRWDDFKSCPCRCPLTMFYNQQKKPATNWGSADASSLGSAGHNGHLATPSQTYQNRSAREFSTLSAPDLNASAAAAAASAAVSAAANGHASRYVPCPRNQDEAARPPSFASSSHSSGPVLPPKETTPRLDAARVAGPVLAPSLAPQASISAPPSVPPHQHRHPHPYDHHHHHHHHLPHHRLYGANEDSSASQTLLFGNQHLPHMQQQMQQQLRQHQHQQPPQQLHALPPPASAAHRRAHPDHAFRGAGNAPGAVPGPPAYLDAGRAEVIVDGLDNGAFVSDVDVLNDAFKNNRDFYDAVAAANEFHRLEPRTRMMNAANAAVSMMPAPHPPALHPPAPIKYSPTPNRAYVIPTAIPSATPDATKGGVVPMAPRFGDVVYDGGVDEKRAGVDAGWRGVELSAGDIGRVNLAPPPYNEVAQVNGKATEL